MAERTLSMRILDSAALQQALARAGFSIARAFDESGQEVEPQARPGPRTPSAPMNAAPDRNDPRSSTRWRRQAIRLPCQAASVALRRRGRSRAYTGARRFGHTVRT